MICPPCRKGGNLNAEITDSMDERTKDYILYRSLESHAGCWWPDSCACRHGAARYIDRSRLP